jgi:trigger factor
MKIIKKEEIKNEIKYIVESDAKIWKNAQELSYKALSKKLKLSGFRSGHVPSEVAKKYISEQEVMNHSLKKTIDENYRLLLQAKDFESEKVIEDALTVDIAEINPKFLRIVYAFEKFPDVTIGDYKKIKINYAEPKIQSEDVEREITRYTKKDIMLVPKDTDIIAKGDMVNFDFKGFIDGKPFAGGEAKGHELEIGSNSFIPGFEEQMIGLKKDDKKTIEVTFPKDYHSKDLANKKAKFELVINDIKIIQKPELNDEYIARFAIPDVKTDEQFKKYVHNQLHEHKKYSARQEAIKEISQ